jgi:hypothetical protein
MTHKSVGHGADAHRPVSADDLRRAFEIAVCELHHADVAAERRLRYRRPILERATVSQVDAEKRAVSDAARALAQLWRV